MKCPKCGHETVRPAVDILEQTNGNEALLSRGAWRVLAALQKPATVVEVVRAGTIPIGSAYRAIRALLAAGYIAEAGQVISSKDSKWATRYVATVRSMEVHVLNGGHLEVTVRMREPVGIWGTKR